MSGGKENSRPVKLVCHVVSVEVVSFGVASVDFGYHGWRVGVRVGKRWRLAKISFQFGYFVVPSSHLRH